MAEKRYIRIDFDDVSRFEGDLQLCFWYSALKNYAKVFKADSSGFHRVSSKTIEEDFGFNRLRVWRYNQRLAEKGFIELDKKRGGNTWMGFKII